MRLRLNVVLTSGLVSAIGLITLLGLLVGDDFGLLSVLVTATPIRLFAQFFVQLSVVVVAFTVLIGVLNLFFVNVTRLFRGRATAKLGSLAVLLSFFVTIFAYVLDKNGAVTRFLLDTVQVSLETSLAGLVFFALVWGAMRLFRHEVTLPRAVFLATVLVVLFGALPFAGELQEIREWVLRVPTTAGARGILLGIALATAVTGVRVLIGQDRQYGE